MKYVTIYGLLLLTAGLLISAQYYKYNAECADIIAKATDGVIVRSLPKSCRSDFVCSFDRFGEWISDCTWRKSMGLEPRPIEGFWYPPTPRKVTN